MYPSVILRNAVTKNLGYGYLIGFILDVGLF